MKIYDNLRSHNARRVRVFLAEKGLEVPRDLVDLTRGESRTAAYLAKNPMGQVPVLELDDGTFISESVAICRYFEEVQPDPPLFGTGARGRAEVEMWSRRIELGLAQPLVRMWKHSSPMWAGRVEQIPALADLERNVVNSFFPLLDTALASREFVAGDRYSLADILALCTLDLGTQAVGLTLDPDQKHLERWHRAVSSRPSARA